MRGLLSSLFSNKNTEKQPFDDKKNKQNCQEKDNKKSCEELNNTVKDNIFNSNQPLQKIRKKIVTKS